MTEPFPEEPEYLEDPEAQLENWEEVVFANNEQEARRICVSRTRKYRTRLMGVKRASIRSKRWYCLFRTYEGEKE